MSIVDIKEFEGMSSIFNGKTGRRFAELFMRFCAIEKINQLYDHSAEYNGTEFTGRLLNDLDVNYVIGNADNLKQLPEGAFITVSNHPYGGLDGIMMIDLMTRIRPDYKFMVNKILSRVKALKDNFISVTPVENKKVDINAATLRGIRETLIHLKKGHPAGFFPSGAVSDFRLRDFRISDRIWQTSTLHLIHSVKVPILPVRFFDGNSPLFYSLGLINWRIRLLRMPFELFNKRGRDQHIGIGNIISVQEQEKYTDGSSLGIFLRKVVYEMPMPDLFIPRTF
jgi:putative hemolysin